MESRYAAWMERVEKIAAYHNVSTLSLLQIMCDFNGYIRYDLQTWRDWRDFAYKAGALDGVEVVIRSHSGEAPLPGVGE